MTPKRFEQAALSLPGAELSSKWPTWRVYEVGGRIFAWMSTAKNPTAAFKVNDVAFAHLIELKGITPARYRARFNFIELESLRALPDNEIKQRLKESHRLVVETLSKRRRPMDK